ncbi:MAG TPA: hypothetical protein DCP90_00750 [Clostridiales bacterium]|nr:MAG: hypothetical protein A2Y22_07990 [Clostridiales bacterium GWD2_32_59]HAN09126.1 hypothetical protein [Clostridiales bacterium]
MKKVLISFLMMVVVVTVLVGCGAKENLKTEEQTSTTKEEVKTVEDTVDLSKIAIVTEDYPPTNYLDENGELKGTSTELVKQALDKLGLSTDIIKVYDWSKAYDMASNDENVLIYTINRTPEREKMFKWIKPVAFDNVYMYKLKTKADVKISSLEDAKKYKVATVAQDFTEEGLVSKGFEVGKNVISAPSQKASIESVFDGKADVFIVASDEASIAKVLDGTDYKMADLERAYKVDELTSVGYIAASLNTSDEIVEKFKEAMPDIENK